MKHNEGIWEINQGEKWPFSVTIECGLLDICEVFNSSVSTSDSLEQHLERNETTAANAKLIAAAPDLLEALQNCQLGIEKMIGWEEVNEQAIKAIKKATE